MEDTVVENACVVGAGIIGLSTAARLLEIRPEIKLTVIYDKQTPNTTTDVAAGLIYPFYYGKSTPHSKIMRWFTLTYEFLEKLKDSDDTLPRPNVYSLSCFDFTDDSSVAGIYWRTVFTKWNELTTSDMSKLIKDKFEYGFDITTLMAEGDSMLSYFRTRLENLGCTFVKRKLHSLTEIMDDFDVIFNCSGLNSRFLVNDHKVRPIKGQLVLVKAPWIKHALVSDDWYIIPRVDCVVLGGTKQFDVWDSEASPEIRKSILERCSRNIPSLKNAEIIRDSVGHRPYRDPIRVEKEIFGGKSSSKSCIVIHNYGHGGSGITLFWGCACDSVDLLVSKNKYFEPKSNL